MNYEVRPAFVLAGNLFDGFNAYGPFADFDEAAEWAESPDGPSCETLIVALDRPQGGRWLEAQFEKMAEAILDDENGVNERSYAALMEFASLVSAECAERLGARVDATDGRFYLPSAT